MSKKLTTELISMRTKCDRLEAIKNLNLWGNDLEDVNILKDLEKLEVVSLSVNRIRTLKPFGYLKYLKELYLRKNNISDIIEVKFLISCPNLRTLWLSENPVAEKTKNYRLVVIKTLPQITKLDDTMITTEERKNADNFDLGSVINNQEDDTEIYEDEDLEEQNNKEQFNKGRKNSDDNYNLVKKKSDNVYREPEIEENLPIDLIQRSKSTLENEYENYKKNAKKKIDEKPITTDNSKPDTKYERISNKELKERKERILLEKQLELEKQKQRPLEKIERVDRIERERPVEKYIEKPIEKPVERQLEREKSKIKERTCLKCVIMLLEELNYNELEFVRSEIDRKLDENDEY